MSHEIYDLAIIGGGIQGCAIALEASTRGLSTLLLEKNELGSGTSSKSTKLIHGGLRYLEYGEFCLVREALQEREILLARTPELVHELRFILPHEKHHRPFWLMQLGLFLYDHLARRKKLQGSRKIRLDGTILQDHFTRGFIYSDCQTDDQALVLYNAEQAKLKGTVIHTHAEVVSARYLEGAWKLTLRDGKVFFAKTLVNALGPWGKYFYEHILKEASPYELQLVQGSHLIVPKFYEGEFAFLLQTKTKRVVFVLPWKGQTMIGTTEVEYFGDPALAAISEAEISDLLSIVNSYFKKQLQASDIISTFSGVRPLLCEPGKKLSAVTRDYSLRFDADRRLLNVLGGKLTIHRKLAQEAVDKITESHSGIAPIAATPP